MEETIYDLDEYINNLKQIALNLSKEGSYKYGNNIKIEINVDKAKEEVKVHISVYDL